VRINLEELKKNYIYVYYIDRKSKVFVAYKLIALRLHVLINCNLSFRIINNLNFRKLLEMLYLNLIFLNCTKLFKIILSKYN